MAAFSFRTLISITVLVLAINRCCSLSTTQEEKVVAKEQQQQKEQEAGRYNNNDDDLSFVSGGIRLDGPDQAGKIPAFLKPYHRRSLDFTEIAFDDPNVECKRGIQYGPENHQKLDIWIPTMTTTKTEGRKGDNTSTGKELLPIVVNIHGGGWDVGYREYVGFMASHLCWKGRQRRQRRHTTDSKKQQQQQQRPQQPQAIMVAPSYKLGLFRDKAWPQNRNDLLRVLQWLRSSGNAESYGGDPSRIILTGHSAGGHLAACIALGCVPEGRDNDLQSCIKGLFLVSCPLGLRQKDWFFADQPWIRWLMTPIGTILYPRILNFMRPIVGTEEEEPHNNRERIAAEASPLAELESLSSSKQMPPASLPFVHYSYAGSGDFPICRRQAKKLQRLLGNDSNAHKRVQVLEMPVDGHLETHFLLNDPECLWYVAISDFLDAVHPENGSVNSRI